MGILRVLVFSTVVVLAACESGDVVHVTPSGNDSGQNNQSITISNVGGSYRLTGDQVVSPVDTDNSGVALVTVVDYDGWGWIPVVDMDVNLDAGVDATAITIHHAAFGQNGPVIHSLQQDLNDPTQWFIKSARLHEDTEENPDFMGHYVSVATSSVPSGELRAQLTSRNWDRDRSGDSLMVMSQSPADGAIVDTAPEEITVSFNRDVLLATATLERVSILASGGDGSFQDGNERMILPTSVAVGGRTMTIGLNGLVLGDDIYQLTLDGSSETPLTDLNNERLNGNFGITRYRADYISTFAIERTAP